MQHYSMVRRDALKFCAFVGGGAFSHFSRRSAQDNPASRRVATSENHVSFVSWIEGALGDSSLALHSKDPRLIAWYSPRALADCWLKKEGSWDLCVCDVVARRHVCFRIAYSQFPPPLGWHQRGPLEFFPANAPLQCALVRPAPLTALLYSISHDFYLLLEEGMEPRCLERPANVSSVATLLAQSSGSGLGTTTIFAASGNQIHELIISKLNGSISSGETWLLPSEGNRFGAALQLPDWRVTDNGIAGVCYATAEGAPMLVATFDFSRRTPLVNVVEGAPKDLTSRKSFLLADTVTDRSGHVWYQLCFHQDYNQPLRVLTFRLGGDKAATVVRSTLNSRSTATALTAARIGAGTALVVSRWSGEVFMMEDLPTWNLPY